MTGTVTATSGSGSPKRKGGKAKAKSSPKSAAMKAKTYHPSSGEMVIAAVKALNDKGGSSLAAIKKYISVNYTVDSAKMSFFIKKSIKAAVGNGTLVQTKGTGASGSFKLPPKEKRGKKTSAGKPKAKKIVAKEPPAAEKETKTAAPTSSPEKPTPKTKKTKKPPTTPKAPKAKKVVRITSPKKTSPAKAKVAAKKKSAPKKK